MGPRSDIVEARSREKKFMEVREGGRLTQNFVGFPSAIVSGAGKFSPAPRSTFPTIPGEPTAVPLRGGLEPCCSTISALQYLPRPR